MLGSHDVVKLHTQQFNLTVIEDSDTGEIAKLVKGMDLFLGKPERVHCIRGSKFGCDRVVLLGKVGHGYMIIYRQRPVKSVMVQRLQHSLCRVSSRLARARQYREFLF